MDDLIPMGNESDVAEYRQAYLEIASYIGVRLAFSEKMKVRKEIFMSIHSSRKETVNGEIYRTSPTICIRDSVGYFQFPAHHNP